MGRHDGYEIWPPPQQPPPPPGINVRYNVPSRYNVRSNVPVTKGEVEDPSGNGEKDLDDEGSGVSEINRRVLTNGGSDVTSDGPSVGENGEVTTLPSDGDNGEVATLRKVYCSYTGETAEEDFMKDFKKRRIALERGVNVFIAAGGPFPTDSFELEAGEYFSS